MEVYYKWCFDSHTDKLPQNNTVQKNSNALNLTSIWKHTKENSLPESGMCIAISNASKHVKGIITGVIFPTSFFTWMYLSSTTYSVFICKQRGPVSVYVDKPIPHRLNYAPPTTNGMQSSIIFDHLLRREDFPPIPFPQTVVEEKYQENNISSGKGNIPVRPDERGTLCPVGKEGCHRTDHYCSNTWEQACGKWYESLTEFLSVITVTKDTQINGNLGHTGAAAFLRL